MNETTTGDIQYPQNEVEEEDECSFCGLPWEECNCDEINSKIKERKEEENYE